MNDLTHNQTKFRHLAILLETSAATLNSVAQRAEQKQARIEDWDDAVAEHEFAKHHFREALAGLTGQSASMLERWLAL